MTINEIAKLAGVSRTTVSRYLNGGYVSEEKKGILKKVIEETGYTPSISAQNLRTKKTNYIGVIIPKINSDSISRMVGGISEVLSEQDYQLLLACTNNDEKEEVKYLNLFRENHVDGVILIGTIFTAEHLNALKALTVPVVILGQELSNYSCIYSDDYHAAYTLGQELAITGNTFGMISVTSKDVAVGKNRRQGFVDAIRDAGKTLDGKSIYEGQFSMDSGYELARELMTHFPDIDTIICATDTIAAGALRRLRELGKRVPEDVQVTGFGDTSIAKATTPTLTTVRFYYEEAGRTSALMLLNNLERGDNDDSDSTSRRPPVNKKLQLEFEINKNESTR